MGRIIYIRKTEALQRFGPVPAVLRKSDGWHAKTACDGPKNGPKFPWRAIPGSPYKQPKKEHHLGTVFWLTPSRRRHGIGGGRGRRKHWAEPRDAIAPISADRPVRLFVAGEIH